jgi:lipoate-protein ligase A
MAPSWRFIESPAQDACANMATDEALFISFCRHLCPPTVRLYAWSSPAFSFGYFQDPAQELDLDLCRAEHIDCVRRMTGGGVIFHHQELTYSLVCTKQDLGAGRSVVESFKRSCQFLLDTYRKLGVEARFAVENPDLHDFKHPSTFCFASQEKYDILVYDRKIGGNAQKRRGEVIFQHGSIPFTLSLPLADRFLRTKLSPDLAKQTCGLLEVVPTEVSRTEFSSMLVDSFQEALGVKLEDGILSPEENSLCRKLKEEKSISSPLESQPG